MCLAPQFDVGFLRLALAEPVLLIHEDGRHAVGERAIQIRVAGKIHPTEFLNRRNESRQLNRILLTFPSIEGETVVQREERIAVGRLGFDGETDEVGRRLPVLPVHREQTHPVAAVELQCEKCLLVLADHLEIARCHVASPLS
jgi:hypothetical protein